MRWRNGLGALSIMAIAPDLIRGYEPHDLETERAILLCRRLAHTLAEESTACGLTKDLIRNAVLYPASSAKFQIADTAHSTLYVNVTSHFFKSTDLCVTNISVKAYSAQR
jgi:hypothetical protein